MLKKKKDFSSVELYIGKGTRVKGNLEVEGSAVIEGSVEGNLNVKGELVIEKGGEIRSKDIKVGNLVCSGKVLTETLTGNRCEFKSSGEFSGNIKCKILVVEEGAKIEGNISNTVDVHTQDKA